MPFENLIQYGRLLMIVMLAFAADFEASLMDQGNWQYEAPKFTSSVSDILILALPALLTVTAKKEIIRSYWLCFPRQ